MKLWILEICFSKSLDIATLFFVLKAILVLVYLSAKAKKEKYLSFMFVKL